MLDPEFIPAAGTRWKWSRAELADQGPFTIMDVGDNGVRYVYDGGATSRLSLASWVAEQPVPVDAASLPLTIDAMCACGWGLPRFAPAHAESMGSTIAAHVAEKHAGAGGKYRITMLVSGF